MVKLALQWEGPPDHHEGYPGIPHSRTRSAVALRARRLPLGLQSRHTTGIEEGEQES